MHAISEQSTPEHPVPGTLRFSHGLGAGDLNGDGRKDVICTGGWWEQPAAGKAADAPWKFHPAAMGTAVADMIAYDVDNDGKQDVIAFSLWGSAPRYLRGMLRNLLLAHDMMPGWIVRIYTDTSLDAEFVGLVQSLGAQVVMQPSGAPTRVRLCWRFQVANDPAVRRFLVRDADATISVREAMAVQAWVQSGRCFHVIRDWWSHTDLMLAGLWGGMANVLPPLAPLQQAYAPRAMETANLDQWFLRDVVWPYVRQSCLVHDRCFRFGDVERPPQAPAVAGSHMGQNESANAHVDQQRWLAPWIERYPCLQERRA